MAPKQFSRNVSSSSKRPVSAVKRGLSLTPGSRTKRARGNVESRPSTSTPYQSSVRRTPAGIPAPTRPRYGGVTTEDSEEDNELYDHVILAIDQLQKSFGCSYYVAEEGRLFCMEDIEIENKDALDILKFEIKPTIILRSPRIEIAEEELRAASNNLQTDQEQAVTPYRIELRPGNDFKYELAVQKISAIPSQKASTGVRYLVPGEEEQHDEIQLDEVGFSDARGRILHITSSVNLESKISISCAGAIITYLQRRKSSEYLEGDPAAENAYQILDLQMFSYKDTMLINPDTLAALQILQPESHPSASHQGPGSNGSKESLSIYGLFRRFAKTPQGRQQLRALFIRPSTDLVTIRAYHGSVGLMARVENRDALQKLSKSLSKVKNMSRTMVSLRRGIEGGTSHRGSIKSGVWSSMLDFCYHIIDVSETLNEIADFHRVPLHHPIQANFDRNEFQVLGKLIFDLVDLEESEEQRRTVIKRGVDDNLDIVKDAYDRMDEMLTETAIQTVPELPAEMVYSSLSVVYLPQLGFHITMPTEDANDLITIGANLDWEKRFVTDSTSYFKNNKMRELDRDLGDLWAQICEREIEISHSLAQQILEKEVFLVTASDLCGQLDALLALAHGTVQYQLVQPRMVEENVIEIKAGRHLIQELTVPAYVANDAFILGGDGNYEDEVLEPPDWPSMVLLTGPNYSGKSVYLKQVALIAYMAQVGSFVPAEYAKLGISDRILTRVMTRETVSKGQSTFMIDLQQMSYALKAVTPRTLLIIDEFGKGTDSCDGAGLMAGILSYLLSLGSQAPKVLASTHFHEIFEQGILSETAPGLVLKQMDVHVGVKDRQKNVVSTHNSEVTYLYNVKPGRSTMSYGAQCAAMNGIPDEIVRRAAQLTDLTLAGEDLIAVCSVVSPKEADELERAEAVSRAFLQLDLEAFDEKQVGELKHIIDDLIATGLTEYPTTTSGESPVTSP